MEPKFCADCGCELKEGEETYCYDCSDDIEGYDEDQEDDFDE